MEFLNGLALQSTIEDIILFISPQQPLQLLAVLQVKKMRRRKVMYLVVMAKMLKSPGLISKLSLWERLSTKVQFVYNVIHCLRT